MTETQLRYATKRIVELESLLLVDVTETVWPAEVGMVYGQWKRRGSPGASPAPPEASYQPHVAGENAGTCHHHRYPVAGRRHGEIRVR